MCKLTIRTLRTKQGKTLPVLPPAKREEEPEPVEERIVYGGYVIDGDFLVDDNDPILMEDGASTEAEEEEYRWRRGKRKRFRRLRRVSS